MITPMDQLLLVGRKPVATEVLVSLQSLGVVQVDRLEPDEGGLERFALSDDDRRRKEVWDRVISRASSLMEVLRVDQDGPGTGKADLPADADGIAERVDSVADQVDTLLAERDEAEEELALVQQYLPLFRDLAPTLAQLETSRWLDGVATILPAAALERLRAELEDALEGRFALSTRARGREVVAVIAALRSEAADLRVALGKAGFGELQLPERYRELGVAKAVHLMEERQQTLPKRLGTIKDELGKLALQHGPRLKTLRQTALNLQARLERLADLAQGRFSFALRGWVPSAFTPRGSVESTAASRTQPYITTPTHPLSSASWARLSPSMAQRGEPPASTTSTRPRPSVSRTARTCVLSSKQRMVAAGPEKAVTPPKSLNGISQTRAASPWESHISAVAVSP